MKAAELINELAKSPSFSALMQVKEVPSSHLSFLPLTTYSDTRTLPPRTHPRPLPATLPGRQANTQWLPHRWGPLREAAAVFRGTPGALLSYWVHRAAAATEDTYCRWGCRDRFGEKSDPSCFGSQDLEKSVVDQEGSDFRAIDP